MRSLTPEHRWKDRYQGDHLFIGFSDADMDREAATRHDVYAKLAADLWTLGRHALLFLRLLPAGY